MNQITDVPVSSPNYGMEFNYNAWTAGTVVTFCNVPWNSDYRDIVRFDNQLKLNDYINNQTGPKLTIDRMSYTKFGRPVRISQPFNAVQKYNYLRASNPLQPVAGDIQKDYYYFIVDVVYVAPNTTEVYLQLDVWQTFGYGVTFGNCYIEQGHIGIANEDQFKNRGRDYLTTPEGLDIGNEYEIHKQYSMSIASARFDSLNMPNFSILVASTITLDDDYGTVENPKLKAAKGSEMENLPNGCELYEFNSLDHFKSFMTYLSDFPWIAQGIISIMAIPRTARYGIDTETTFMGPSNIAVRQITSGPLDNKKTAINTNWRNEMPFGRYDHLKKFFTYPYMVLEMTSYTGTPLVLKPECWQDDDMSVVEVPHFAPPNPRLAVYPYRYNATDNSPSSEDVNGIINDGGEFLDMVTGIFNFPTFSITNNGYLQFMASNANGLAFQHSSADWSQQRALQGNSVSYDQASSAINLSKDLVGQSMNAATQSTSLANETAGYRAIQSGINSMGSLKHGPAGAVGAVAGIANAGVGYAIDTNQNNQSLGIANNLAAGQNRSTTDQSAYIRDTNKSLADWSANGDYQNSIAAINAKVQDAKLTQPTTAGQVGGDAFNLATYRWGIDIKVKVPQPGVLNAIGEYWLRYGYAIQRFSRMPASYMVMSKFTYWKLKETYITGASCPETFKQAIRGIFEKGVTVWKNPADIGNIDIADNTPLPGVKL